METEFLFQELDALFFNSWARPGVDLQPEIWLLGTKVQKGGGTEKRRICFGCFLIKGMF